MDKLTDLEFARCIAAALLAGAFSVPDSSTLLRACTLRPEQR